MDTSAAAAAGGEGSSFTFRVKQEQPDQTESVVATAENSGRTIRKVTVLDPLKLKLLNRQTHNMLLSGLAAAKAKAKPPAPTPPQTESTIAASITTVLKEEPEKGTVTEPSKVVVKPDEDTIESPPAAVTGKPPSSSVAKGPGAGGGSTLFRRKKVVPAVIAKKIAQKEKAKPPEPTKEVAPKKEPSTIDVPPQEVAKVEETISDESQPAVSAAVPSEEKDKSTEKAVRPTAFRRIKPKVAICLNPSRPKKSILKKTSSSEKFPVSNEPGKSLKDLVPEETIVLEDDDGHAEEQQQQQQQQQQKAKEDEEQKRKQHEERERIRVEEEQRSMHEEERKAAEEKRRMEKEQQRRKADERRRMKDEERKKAEERRRIEEEEMWKAVERRRIEEEEMRKAEERRQMEENENRKAEEKRRIEEENRKAEHQRRIEEEKKAKLEAEDRSKVNTIRISRKIPPEVWKRQMEKMRNNPNRLHSTVPGAESSQLPTVLKDSVIVKKSDLTVIQEPVIVEAPAVVQQDSAKQVVEPVEQKATNQTKEIRRICPLPPSIAKKLMSSVVKKKPQEFVQADAAIKSESVLAVVEEPKPTAVTAERKPTALIVESKPSAITAEPKPTALTVESEPTAVTAESKPTATAVVAQTKAIRRISRLPPNLASAVVNAVKQATAQATSVGKEEKGLRASVPEGPVLGVKTEDRTDEATHFVVSVEQPAPVPPPTKEIKRIARLPPGIALKLLNSVNKRKTNAETPAPVNPPQQPLADPVPVVPTGGLPNPSPVEQQAGPQKEIRRISQLPPNVAMKLVDSLKQKGIVVPKLVLQKDNPSVPADFESATPVAEAGPSEPTTPSSTASVPEIKIEPQEPPSTKTTRGKVKILSQVILPTASYNLEKLLAGKTTEGIKAGPSGGMPLPLPLRRVRKPTTSVPAPPVSPLPSIHDLPPMVEDPVVKDDVAVEVTVTTERDDSVDSVHETSDEIIVSEQASPSNDTPPVQYESPPKNIPQRQEARTESAVQQNVFPSFPVSTPQQYAVSSVASSSYPPATQAPVFIQKSANVSSSQSPPVTYFAKIPNNHHQQQSSTTTPMQFRPRVAIIPQLRMNSAPNTTPAFYRPQVAMTPRPPRDMAQRMVLNPVRAHHHQQLHHIQGQHPRFAATRFYLVRHPTPVRPQVQPQFQQQQQQSRHHLMVPKASYHHPRYPPAERPSWHQVLYPTPRFMVPQQDQNHSYSKPVLQSPQFNPYVNPVIPEQTNAFRPVEPTQRTPPSQVPQPMPQSARIIPKIVIDRSCIEQPEDSTPSPQTPPFEQLPFNFSPCSEETRNKLRDKLRAKMLGQNSQSGSPSLETPSPPPPPPPPPTTSVPMASPGPTFPKREPVPADHRFLTVPQRTKVFRPEDFKPTQAQLARISQPPPPPKPSSSDSHRIIKQYICQGRKIYLTKISVTKPPQHHHQASPSSSKPEQVHHYQSETGFHGFPQTVIKNEHRILQQFSDTVQQLEKRRVSPEPPPLPEDDHRSAPKGSSVLRGSRIRHRKPSVVTAVTTGLEGETFIITELIDTPEVAQEVQIETEKEAPPVPAPVKLPPRITTRRNTFVVDDSDVELRAEKLPCVESTTSQEDAKVHVKMENGGGAQVKHEESDSNSDSSISDEDLARDILALVEKERKSLQLDQPTKKVKKRIIRRKRRKKKKTRNRQLMNLLMKHVNQESLIADIVEKQRKKLPIVEISSDTDDEDDELRQRWPQLVHVKKDPDAAAGALATESEVEIESDESEVTDIFAEILKPFVERAMRDEGEEQETVCAGITQQADKKTEEQSENVGEEAVAATTDLQKEHRGQDEEKAETAIAVTVEAREEEKERPVSVEVIAVEAAVADPVTSEAVGAEAVAVEAVIAEVVDTDAVAAEAEAAEAEAAEAVDMDAVASEAAVAEAVAVEAVFAEVADTGAVAAEAVVAEAKAAEAVDTDAVPAETVNKDAQEQKEIEDTVVAEEEQIEEAVADGNQEESANAMAIESHEKEYEQKEAKAELASAESEELQKQYTAVVQSINMPKVTDEPEIQEISVEIATNPNPVVEITQPTTKCDQICDTSSALSVNEKKPKKAPAQRAAKRKLKPTLVSRSKIRKVEPPPPATITTDAVEDSSDPFSDRDEPLPATVDEEPEQHDIDSIKPNSVRELVDEWISDDESTTMVRPVGKHVSFDNNGNLPCRISKYNALKRAAAGLNEPVAVKVSTLEEPTEESVHVPKKALPQVPSLVTELRAVRVSVRKADLLEREKTPEPQTAAVHLEEPIVPVESPKRSVLNLLKDWDESPVKQIIDKPRRADARVLLDRIDSGELTDLRKGDQPLVGPGKAPDKPQDASRERQSSLALDNIALTDQNRWDESNASEPERIISRIIYDKELYEKVHGVPKVSSTELDDSASNAIVATKQTRSHSRSDVAPNTVESPTIRSSGIPKQTSIKSWLSSTTSDSPPKKEQPAIEEQQKPVPKAKRSARNRAAEPVAETPPPAGTSRTLRSRTKSVFAEKAPLVDEEPAPPEAESKVAEEEAPSENPAEKEVIKEAGGTACTAAQKRKEQESKELTTVTTSRPVPIVSNRIPIQISSEDEDDAPLAKRRKVLRKRRSMMRQRSARLADLSANRRLFRGGVGTNRGSLIADGNYLGETTFIKSEPPDVPPETTEYYHPSIAGEESYAVVTPEADAERLLSVVTVQNNQIVHAQNYDEDAETPPRKPYFPNPAATSTPVQLSPVLPPSPQEHIFATPEPIPATVKRKRRTKQEMENDRKRKNPSENGRQAKEQKPTIEQQPPAQQPPPPTDAAPRTKRETKSVIPMAVDTVDPAIREFQCATCSEQVPRDMWDRHYAKHVGVTYRVGVDPVVDLHDETVATSIVARFMKQHRQVTIYCDKCNVAKKSALGLVSHRLICGMTKQEIEASKITCEFCNRKLMAVSMICHQASHCPVLKKRKQEQDMELAKLNPPQAEHATSNSQGAKPAVLTHRGTVKRQATAKAEQRIQNISFGELILSVSKDKVTDGCLALWKTQFRKAKTALCVFRTCEFTGNDEMEMRHHHEFCPSPCELFECKNCKYQTERIELMAKHIKLRHSSVLDSITAADSSGTDAKMTSESSDDGETFGVNENIAEAFSADPDEDDGDGRPKKAKRKLLKSLLKSGGGHRYGNPREQFSEESDVYREMILDELIHLRALKSDFHLTAREWTKEFRLMHYSRSVLFPGLRPDLDVRFLTFNLVQEYIPKRAKSLRFIIRSTNLYNAPALPQEYTEKWQHLDTFSGQVNDKETIFYCGGPIVALDWLPMPDGQNDHQILAVACKNDFDEFYLADRIYPTKCLIQIWNVGFLSNSSLHIKKVENSPPVLLYAIACNFGPIWSLKFCPSGCYNFKDKGDEYDRLGLLAAAGSDGNVHIYSLARNYENLISNSYRVVNLTPVLKLTLSLEGDSNCPQYECHSAVKLSWSKSKNHTVIAAGYSNGAVAVWNLNSTSPLLTGTKDGVRALLPVHKAFIPDACITAVDLHYSDDTRYLLVCNADRKVVVFDLSTGYLPVEVCNLNARSKVTTACWNAHFPLITMAFDDVYAIDRCALTFHQTREIGLRLHPLYTFSAEATDMSSCEHLSTHVIGTDGGDVLCHQPMAYVHQMAQKNSQQMKYVLTSTISVKVEDNLTDNSYNMFYKNYGVLFSDSDKNPARMDLRALQVKSFRRALLHEYPGIRINQVRWNPNETSHQYYAIGYQAGFVRVRAFRFK